MIVRLLTKFTYITLSLSFLLSGCNQTKDIKAAVVSARKEASDIGITILNKGGSAFDAMIATDLALTVCFPNAGNISGGGFLVYRTASGEVGSLDYREKAPLNAFEKMYLDENGDVIPEKSTLGGLAVGVPGTVAGLAEIHSKFGTLPWEDLVKPAIDLATNGYIVTEKQERSFRNKKDDFIRINGVNTFYAQDFKAGDTVKVGYKVTEGTRSRVQNYEGVCIARKNGVGIAGSFTVRKISFGEGVERVFPLYSTNIESITVVRRGRVRRAKLYYLRSRRGKSARIAEDTNYKPKTVKE